MWPVPPAHNPGERSRSTGRSVLIGDACHALPPNLAQGATVAIEDAMELAVALHASESLPDAFARFRERREARVLQCRQCSFVRCNCQKVPSTASGVTLPFRTRHSHVYVKTRACVYTNDIHTYFQAREQHLQEYVTKVHL